MSNEDRVGSTVDLPMSNEDTSASETDIGMSAAAALILALREEDLWPALVPSVVLVECLQGHPGRDALANRFLKTCDLVEEIGEPLARRAALLRRMARRGSAVDALVVALAEPGGTVLTSDLGDLEALALYSRAVRVEKV